MGEEVIICNGESLGGDVVWNVDRRVGYALRNVVGECEGSAWLVISLLIFSVPGFV